MKTFLLIVALCLVGIQNLAGQAVQNRKPGLGVLAGRVLVSGTPLAGATVRAEGIGVPREIRTSDDGTYKFDDMPLGAYLLTPVLKGFFGDAVRASVGPSGGDPIDLKMTSPPSGEGLQVFRGFSATAHVTVRRVLPPALSCEEDHADYLLLEVNAIFKGDLLPSIWFERTTSGHCIYRGHEVNTGYDENPDVGSEHIAFLTATSPYQGIFIPVVNGRVGRDSAPLRQGMSLDEAASAVRAMPQQ